MGRTPDRLPGPIQEHDHIQMYSDGDPGEGDGIIRYVSGSPDRFEMVDGEGAFDPSFTPAKHELVDSLVHQLAESTYTEVTRSAGQISNITVWTDVGKTTKVRETLITRSGGQVSQVVEKQYDGTGVLVQTLTHDITRTGGLVTSLATVES